MLGEASLVQKAIADELGDDGFYLLLVGTPSIELVTYLLLGTLLPGAVVARLGQQFGGCGGRHGAKMAMRPSNSQAFEEVQRVRPVHCVA